MVQIQETKMSIENELEDILVIKNACVDVNQFSRQDAKKLENRIRRIQDKLEAVKIQFELTQDPSISFTTNVDLERKLRKKDYDYGWQEVMKGLQKKQNQ